MDAIRERQMRPSRSVFNKAGASLHNLGGESEREEITMRVILVGSAVGASSNTGTKSIGGSPLGGSNSAGTVRNFAPTCALRARI